MSNSLAWGRALLDSGPAQGYLALAAIALGVVLWCLARARRGTPGRWRQLTAAAILAAVAGVATYALYQNVVFQQQMNYFRSKDDPGVQDPP